MRRDKVFRFTTIAFAVGAFTGLICGLAFGGGDGGTPKAVAQSEQDSSDVSTQSSELDPGTGEPMTAERARTIGANEMGQVLVLMYHHFDSEETEWTHTPDSFRNDIALLKAEGYFPVNLRDLASGNIDIPAGKSPVVLTFDDSSPGQYRILDDGTLDPDCAVGIMQAAVEAGDWAPRASFFVLLDVVPKERSLWGQPDLKQGKLSDLVDWGYEVGSHTITHLNLQEASASDAIWQLAESQATLEDLIGGGYQVTSLALPYGNYPASDDILAGGEYEGITYAYTAAVSIANRVGPSPFSTEFDALHIPRIRGSDYYVTGNEYYLAEAIKDFKTHPELRYISDGDPTTVSAPADLDAALGQVAEDLGRPVVLY
jgi:peptidoglycan/xylan/chitin deacetylase (PgdA/CDA1 family)